MDRSRALVIGWYGHQNLGDESYKLTFPKIFGDRFELQFSDSASLDNNHAAIFLGGGDIFAPDFVSKVSAIDRPRYAASITMPSNPNIDDLKQFKWIAVRDHKSFSTLLKSGYPTEMSFYCPDFAFMLEGNPYRGKELLTELFKAEDRDLYEKKVIVAINSHLIAKPGDETRKHVVFENFAFHLSSICDSTNASFIFMPFSTHMPWDDRTASGMVASRCKFWKKNMVLYNRLCVQDSLDIISAVDATISTRLHSSIFSCASGTPFIDITHNHKNSTLLEDTNLQELSISYWKLNPENLHNKLIKVIEERSSMNETLKQVVKQQRALITGFSEHVRSL